MKTLESSTEIPTKPMDINELQPCALCGRGVMAEGHITFYEIRIGQCVVDLRNVQRMHGLEQMMGGVVPLARVLSPDNTVARRLPDVRKLVCQECGLMKPVEVAILGEEDE